MKACLALARRALDTSSLSSIWTCSRASLTCCLAWASARSASFSAASALDTFSLAPRMDGSLSMSLLLRPKPRNPPRLLLPSEELELDLRGGLRSEENMLLFLDGDSEFVL